MFIYTSFGLSQAFLTVIGQLVVPLVLLHLAAPALHALGLGLQQLEEPVAVALAHRAAHHLQRVLRHTVDPRVGRRQDGRVEAHHVLVVVRGASVVVVARALDADGGGGGIA